MTPQEVIKKFMAALVDNNATGTTLMDAAVKASSDFTSKQAVINQMLTDQKAAEREAIKYVLGNKYNSSYNGKQLSEISLPSMTWAEVKDKTALNVGDTYGNYLYSAGNITLANIIKENASKIFLEKYCGIQLNSNYIVDFGGTGYGLDGMTFNGVYYANKSTDNVDTGAITGSDANITLTAGDVVNKTTLTSANLKSLAAQYGTSASLSSDGNTIVIGTGARRKTSTPAPKAGSSTPRRAMTQSLRADATQSTRVRVPIKSSSTRTNRR